jgi:diaminohydroxyphosphoribosylaminopyrimidine deaminase/5-amino-6-(5-phosphoribosylamino)uracil reductase
VNNDTSFMRLALRLGRRGLGRTSPNPAVGAVVVRGGRVVGRGYHRQAGAPHAEVEALGEAGARARGATLFVTLEPCNHHGRTPPCTEAILRAGVEKVVVGVRDPNPSVAGKGIERLRRRRVQVEVGVEAAACAELVASFRKHIETGLPLVTLKLAASLDGRIATRTGESRWITGPTARSLVHRMRNEMDALMVGAQTIIDDDPLLTCRLRGGRDPLRVIVDGRLRVPLTAKVLTNESAPGTLIATVLRKPRILESLRRKGATALVLPGRNGVLSLRRLLRALGKRGVSSVLIEGGGTLAAHALRERVVDRLVLFYGPKLIGADGRPMLGTLGVAALADAAQLRDLRIAKLGPDLVVRAQLGV